VPPVAARFSTIALALSAAPSSQLKASATASCTLPVPVPVPKHQFPFQPVLEIESLLSLNLTNCLIAERIIQ
jgi:hypothetical protein